MNSDYENNHHNNIFLEEKKELSEVENKCTKENIFLPVQVEKYLNVFYNII